MRSSSLRVFALAALCGGACLPAAPLKPDAAATAASLRDGALQGTGAFDIVRSLSYEVGPRSAGSPGDAAAVAWGVAKLNQLGFANVRAEKVTVPHWVRGVAVGEIRAPYPQPVVLAALGGSAGTPAGGLTAEVIELPDLAALEKAPADKVQGKIVYVSNRMKKTRDASGYGTAVAVRGRGPSVAAKLGAVALLIRSVGTDSDRVAHTGATRYAEGVAKIPAAALSNPDADLLSAEVASGRPVTFHLELGSHDLPPAESANVIGEIPGREKPEEIVLLGAHLDSWDLGTGAIDDGAGCAIMIEAARRIGELKVHPRRTIRVVLFANEEFGLSGGRAYAEAHAAELPHHVMAGESDLGSGRVYELGTRAGATARPGIEEILAVLKPLGVADGGEGGEGGSDLIPLGPARVPIMSLAQDATRYFDLHHTANDTPDKIDPKDLDQNVAAWAALAYVAAEREGDFGRAPEPKAER